VLNLLVAVALTFVFRAMKAPEGQDATVKEDYRADSGEEGVEEELPELA